ncbi:MAG TPA: type II secretion system protein [bacterium]|nr:type II secretion system protein [bacterium]
MRKLMNQKGYTIIELSIAVLILGAMASAVLMARSFMAKQTVRNTDKAFATQKAIQMYEELRALVNGNEKAGVAVLDDYSDGSVYNTVLTTDKTIDVPAPGTPNPGDNLSGNIKSNGNWRYLRQVQVSKVANDPYIRQVVIRVWRYASDKNPNSPGELLATVGGEMRTITSLFPPTQVMDVYILAIANIQAWWAVLPSLSNTMQGVLSDIQSRNPGLELRVHYITRSAYGRDSQYLPFINQAAGTEATRFPWVYLYAGMTMQEGGGNGCGCDTAFYDPGTTGVQQDGNLNVDGSIINVDTSQFTGCPRFTAADQFNNGMRYPDELATYKAVTAAAAAANATVPEISERMLIEGMLSSPQSFTNSIIVNLHGELLPLPSMRNYSDPAKDPVDTPNVRVVTHPEFIYYPATNSAAVSLRVYGYYDGLNNPSSLPSGGSVTASIFLPDVTLGSVTATAIQGGGTAADYGVTYAPVNLVATAGGTTVFSGSSAMGVAVTNPGPGNTQTLITLYNIPLRCPSAPPTASGPVSAGLPVTNRLYQLEYIPSSPEKTSGTAFTAHDLTWAGAGPKNTARFVLSFPMPVTSVLTFTSPVTIMGQTYSGASTFKGQHIIETRIGEANTDFPADPPPNLSRSYVWVGNAFPPPYTERYQFMGDPRDCPYLDVKVGGIGGGSATIEANGYNWWFRNLNGTTDGYTGFGQAGTNDGWGPDQAEIDIPRYDEMIRNGLLGTTSIWTTTNGWSFYYYGIGGEFGFDHPPFSGSLTFLNNRPWSTTAGSVTNLTRVCEIIDSAGSGQNHTRWIASIANAGTTQQWYAKSWLGELYPDSLYSCWATVGNIPTLDNTSSFPMTFFRSELTSIYSSGSLYSPNHVLMHRAQGDGAPAFFDGVSGSNSFRHNSGSWSGDVLSLATTCYGIFQYPMPVLVDAQRPWDLSGSTSPTDEWGIAPYNTAPVRTTLSIPQVSGQDRIFYDNTGNSNYNTAGVVKMSTSSPSQAAYVVETGTSPSANVGTAELAKTTLLFGLRTFLDGGQMAVTGAVGHISQIPLIKVYPVKSDLTINPVPQFANPQTIILMIGGPNLNAAGTQPLANVWFRYPGGTATNANYYTEEYPNYGSAVTASTYAENTALVYNLKYSKDTGKTWFYIQDASQAVTAYQGVYNSAYSISNSLPVTNVVYNWDVSNAAKFPQGDYWVSAEVYRQNIPQHYAYHTVVLTIDR